MVAGIVLVALGLKKTLAHVDDPLATVPTFALLGGLALYLLGLVGFRYRHVHTINRQRLLLALVLLALVPAATELPALATLAVVTVLLSAMIVYETISYGRGAPVCATTNSSRPSTLPPSSHLGTPLPSRPAGCAVTSRAILAPSTIAIIDSAIN